MRNFHVIIENEEFKSSDELRCDHLESARKRAVAAALAIASEQVASGKPFFGAQVTIRDGDESMLRLVVSAGASPLKDSGS